MEPLQDQNSSVESATEMSITSAFVFLSTLLARVPIIRINKKSEEGPAMTFCRITFYIFCILTVFKEIKPKVQQI